MEEEEEGRGHGWRYAREIRSRRLCACHAFPFYVSFVTAHLYFRQDFNLCSALPFSFPATLFILSAPFQCPFAYFVRRLRRRRRRPDITFQFLMNQKMERKRLSLSRARCCLCRGVFPFLISREGFPLFPPEEFKLDRHVNCHTTPVSHPLDRRYSLTHACSLTHNSQITINSILRSALIGLELAVVSCSGTRNATLVELSPTRTNFN